MTDIELLTAADVQLMQRMAQRVTAARSDLVNTGASYGELAWCWGRGHAARRAGWPRRLWFAGGELVAWAWAQLPHAVRLSDGSVRDVTGAYLAYQVDPEHAGLVDEVIDWFDATAGDVERTVIPNAEDVFGLERWAAHGYVTDPEGLGDTGSWTQLNVRDLTEIEEPVLPDGFRFVTADEAGPEAVLQAHLGAWAPSPFSAEGYEGVRATEAYRGDLHVLVQAPDGTMAASAVVWLDEVNRTAEFEPVGTHRDYQRRGLGRAVLLRGMLGARAAGAEQMTVACLGAPGHQAARGLYYSVGFRMFTRDVPLLKTAG